MLIGINSHHLSSSSWSIIYNSSLYYLSNCVSKIWHKWYSI